MNRPSSDKQRGALKMVVGLAMKLVGGGDCFCHATRVNAGVLSTYANPRHDATHMPIDVALDLDLACGEPHVAAMMARICGYRLVPLDGTDAGPDLSDLASVARETGEAVSAFAAALADGRIDDRETAILRKEFQEAHAAINRVMAKLGGGA